MVVERSDSLAGFDDLGEMFSEDNMEETIDTLMENLGLDELVSSIKSMFQDIEPMISDFFAGLGIENPLADDDEEDEETTDEDLMSSETAVLHDEAAVEGADVAESTNQYMKNVISSKPEIEGYVGRFEGNGGRDAAVIKHKNFDSSKPFKVITHLHGAGESYDPQKTERFEQTVDAFKAKCEENGDYQIVLAYPLSGGVRSRQPDKYKYDEQWFREPDESFRQFHYEVLSVVENEFGGDARRMQELILQVHSAGGRAAMNVVDSGFPLDRIVMLDSAYGRWAEHTVARALQNNPHTRTEIFTIAGTDTEQNSLEAAEYEGVTCYYVESGVNHGETIDEYHGGIDPNSARAQRMRA